MDAMDKPLSVQFLWCIINYLKKMYCSFYRYPLELEGLATTWVRARFWQVPKGKQRVNGSFMGYIEFESDFHRLVKYEIRAEYWI